MTVLEVIQKSAEFLARKGVESPRLHAELLLAHVLGLPRMRLYLEFDRQVTSEQADSMRELVKRRALREPLQHIVGSTSFCGFEIAVNRHALIPRPETELLAERAWQFLNHLSAKGIPTPRALDFGTGSGCLAIAMAARCPSATVTALDVSPEALALAAENAQKHGVRSRIQFLQSDGFEGLPRVRDRSIMSQPSQAGGLESGSDFSDAQAMAKGSGTRNGTDPERLGGSLALPSESRPTGIPEHSEPRLPKFHLLVSNPPYIPTSEIATLSPEVRDFDPALALDGGEDGLVWYRRLASEARPLVDSDGCMMLEFGDGQAEPISEILRRENWVVEEVVADYTQRPRILVARRT